MQQPQHTLGKGQVPAAWISISHGEERHRTHVAMTLHSKSLGIVVPQQCLMRTWFHLGLRPPTRADRCVLLRYFGGLPLLSHWLTPADQPRSSQLVHTLHEQSAAGGTISPGWAAGMSNMIAPLPLGATTSVVS